MSDHDTITAAAPTSGSGSLILRSDVLALLDRRTG